MTRRAFLAGLLPVARRAAAKPALIELLDRDARDPRAFTLGQHWTLVATPRVPAAELEVMAELAGSAVIIAEWRELRFAEDRRREGG